MREGRFCVSERGEIESGGVRGERKWGENGVSESGESGVNDREKE